MLPRSIGSNLSAGPGMECLAQGRFAVVPEPHQALDMIEMMERECCSALSVSMTNGLDDGGVIARRTIRVAVVGMGRQP